MSSGAVAESGGVEQCPDRKGNYDPQVRDFMTRRHILVLATAFVGTFVACAERQAAVSAAALLVPDVHS